MNQITAGSAVVQEGPPGKTQRMREAPARRRFAIDVALGAVLMILVHLFVVQISIVKGHSMEPSLHDGDRLVVDRVFSDLHRGQMIVLRYPRNPQVDFVKRIVGVPGDCVHLRDGHLYVNGEMADNAWTCIEDLDSTVGVKVPQGHYFVLGDNRNHSFDSHYWGFLPVENIIGHATLLYWPPSRFGFVDPDPELFT